jgi:UDP-N-acetylglucosamine acyltransferase
MYAAINRVVPPFIYVAGQFAVPRGVNAEGLKRRGFDATRIRDIKRAYKTLYKSGLPLAEARTELARAATGAPDVKLVLDFIERSERSLIR